MWCESEIAKLVILTFGYAFHLTPETGKSTVRSGIWKVNFTGNDTLPFAYYVSIAFYELI
jgi:hypothetical protein